MRKDTWNIISNAEGFVVNDIISTIVRKRGVTNPQEFFNPDTTHIYPSNLLCNIDKAVSTLKLVLNYPNPDILIYADVDTDGCCSAAILKHYLRKLGIDATTYINEGKEHGVTKDFTDYWLSQGSPDLVIVVDSINETMEAYEKIWAAGCQLIILDHHIPKSEICENSEALNLVSSALNYPNPQLSGSGVVWKFVSYLDYINNTNYAEELVDLAATGIIADICSVGTDSMENRAICNLGFKHIYNPGIARLIGEDTLTATNVSFGIAPIINSANRNNKNNLALELLCTERQMTASKIIKELEQAKKEEKIQINHFYKLLEEQVEAQKDECCYYLIMPEKTNFAGVLASKFCGKYNRPCVVIAKDGNQYGGSIRAKGIDNFSALVNQSGFAECNGHENSAGISIPVENLEALKQYIREALSNNTFKECIDVDVKINRSQITPFLINKINELNKICGQNFNAVKFLIEDVTRYQVKPLSAGKHLSLETSDMKFLYWNFDNWDTIKENSKFSAIGTLSQSFFRGRSSIDMIMEDFIFDQSFEECVLW